VRGQWLMELDAQSRMNLEGVNRGGVPPYSQFGALEPHDRMLKPQDDRAPIPRTLCGKVSEESVQVTDAGNLMRFVFSFQECT
jgi:hypothetical protein